MNKPVDERVNNGGYNPVDKPLDNPPNNPMNNRLDKHPDKHPDKPVGPCSDKSVQGGWTQGEQRRWPPRGMASVLGTVLRYAWPAPWTALGLLLALPAVALGARGAWRDGVLELTGGRRAQAAAKGWAGGFVALTLGHVVLAVSPPVLERLRVHERCHVHQYERWGPLFVPAYLIAGAWAWARGQGAYAGNPFERQACAADAAAWVGNVPGGER